MAAEALYKLIESLNSFDSIAEYTRIVEDNTARITELQLQQMAAGIDKTGSKRADSYEPMTIRYKDAFGVGLGAITDRVTFFMTGAMYNEMKTTVEGDVFKTEALGDFKFDKMIERVGVENYGLDEDSRRIFAEQAILPEFSRTLESLTGIIV